MKQLEFSELTPVQQTLVNRAVEIRQRAYAPYSNYKVGVALVDEKDNIHAGCNIESADYTLTTHAEMDAINTMVKTGVLQRKGIAFVVKSDVGNAMPCGLCRQKIREFSASPNVQVIGINLDKSEKIQHIFIAPMSELFPYGFGPDFLAMST